MNRKYLVPSSPAIGYGPTRQRVPSIAAVGHDASRIAWDLKHSPCSCTYGAYGLQLCADLFLRGFHPSRTIEQIQHLLKDPVFDAISTQGHRNSRWLR